MVNKNPNVAVSDTTIPIAIGMMVAIRSPYNYQPQHNQWPYTFSSL